VTYTHLVSPGLETESWSRPHGKRSELGSVFLGEPAADRDLVAGFPRQLMLSYVNAETLLCK